MVPKPRDTFTEYVEDQLSGLKGLEIRRMFGGKGLYLEENFFAILFDGKIYFKTSPANLPDYLASGSKPLVYQKKGKKTVRLKNYYEVPPHVLEDRDTLEKWAIRSASI